MHVRIPPVLAAMALLAPAAIAQQPPDSVRVDSARYDLGSLTVRVARPALTTGGSSAVVLRLDSLARVPGATMEQVLRAMPLIQIRTNSRGEAQPALRGSEDRQVAILFDGVPLTLGWDHRTDMSIIPLSAARSVTLVRGLSSILYGPNTLGGVVEVDVARTRERLVQVDPLSAGVSFDGTGATNLSATTAALFDREESQWVVRAGAGFHDRPGMSVPGGVGRLPQIRARFLADGDLRLNSDVRRVDGFLSARMLRDGGAWASLSASAFDAERGVPPEAHQDLPRLWRYPDQRRLITAVSAGTGQRQTRFGEGDLEASVGVDLGSYRIDGFDSEAYRTVVEREEADDRTVTVRALAEHTLGRGADVRASATYADISHDEVLTPGTASGYRQRLWSAGLETEWRFGDGDRSHLSFGVAVDGADTPESGDKPSLGVLDDYGFRVGASTLLTGRTLVHASLSRRARFPSLRELYSGALGRFQPNPDLRAETLLGTEAGLTYEGRAAELQVVGFHHRLDDGIVRTTVRGSDGVRRFQRINQAEVRSTGLEILAGGSYRDVALSGDLTLQHVGGLDADGHEVELEYEPSLTGRMGLELPLPAGVRGSGEVRYVGRQMCQNPEAGGLQPLASSRTLDLSLRRLFGLRAGGRVRRLDTSLSVRNATDAAVFDQCGLPQPGRTLQVQVRIW